jgi:hypothetical protein
MKKEMYSRDLCKEPEAFPNVRSISQKKGGIFMKRGRGSRDLCRESEVS